MHVMFSVERHPTAARFLIAAGEFLGRREAEHNLQFGIASHLIADEALAFDDVVRHPYLATVRGVDGHAVVGSALMTPPFDLVLSCLADEVRAQAVDALVRDLASFDVQPPGVLGPVEVAHTFAAAWCAGRALTVRRARAERIYQLKRVRPPRNVGGHARIATPADRELLIDWIRSFLVEVNGEDPDTIRDDRPADLVASSLDRGQGTVYLWEVDGAAVSMARAHGETPNGIRIGPVYTPPEVRGHGFASAVTAAASQASLDAGRRFVFLFTDLANPTSNKIYQAIGYEPVIDIDQLAFDPA